MKADVHRQLDHPVWFSLKELHHEFSLGNDVVKRYQRHIAPFIAHAPGKEDRLDELNSWLLPDEIIYYFGDLNSVPTTWLIEKELDCVQMILSSHIAGSFEGKNIIPMTADDSVELFDLIQEVQPGYYLPDSILMGRYFGIRVDHQLVAVAGERLGFNGYTEVSGICTIPEFRGRGYAHDLTSYVCDLNVKAGHQVFLHALHSNSRAIAVYEHLGFKLRRRFPIWKIRKQ